ncbi:MAG: 2-hydroxychromene-2-carboxylate isomerase [Myxococcales bacterium]|nr:2-hydroxychromene-2-carboxylate isomerase [Myxococcales bacterium]
MTRTLEFCFDYGSPYSYLADTQLDGVRARTGAGLVYRPILLGGVFKATGNRSPGEEPVEAKRRYGAVETRRWVEYYGVPFSHNPFFPINTLAIMRACVAAQQLGQFEPFHRAIYPAFWVEGLDLGDPGVFAGVLEKAGLDPVRIREWAARQEIKDELRAATERAVARGVFGAPSFFVGDELFFGADRLPFVERALLREPG